VLIGIADRGVGMTAEFIREHLFRPFTSSKHDGFGIGVYQARELLRQAGGDLIATSEPNRGTTMQIVLPAAPAFDLASARTEDAS
jgi:signal transduction histidine kinase